jgi:hypothetical protein
MARTQGHAVADGSMRKSTHFIRAEYPFVARTGLVGALPVYV